MYVSELPAKIIEDRRKSMRTSAIIHGIIILLAILPFLKSPLQPKEYKQAILVEFKSGSSSEGARKAAPNNPEESSAAAAAATEVEEEREVKPETKPIETTPPPAVLTSKTEPPLVAKSKVRKVDVKAPHVPAETIPQKTKVKDVPTPAKQDVVLKPSKVKKVIIKIERPTKTGSGSSSTSTTSTGNGKSDSKSSSAGNGTGGDGTSADGKGKTDGDGKGDKGTGKSDNGSGANGKGKGDMNGDGVLTRRIISYPDFGGLVKESGKMAVNICVDRQGYVSEVEFNPRYSTIKDRDLIQLTVERSKEYKFEPDASAPVRECGRMTFVIEIDEGL